jgi:hypothetical protein
MPSLSVASDRTEPIVMTKGSTKKPNTAIDESVLDEIFGAFITAEINPTERLFAILANGSGWTVASVKDHYKVRLREQTGTDDDPLMLPPPQIG